MVVVDVKHHGRRTAADPLGTGESGQCVCRTNRNRAEKPIQRGCEFASTQATRPEYRGRGNYAPSGLFCIDHFVTFWTSVSLYSSPSR